MQIQEDIRLGLYNLTWSYILEYENSKNPLRERQEQIAKWREYSKTNINESDEILKIAAIVRQKGVKKVDSLHIACAIKSKADYFLTTDDGILKKTTLIHNFKITDPIGFIKEVSE